MANRLMLDLDDLEVETFESTARTDAMTLEALTTGHGVAEVDASCIGPTVFVCSCCWSCQ